MSNTSFHVRARRWIKYLFKYGEERVRGLNFSMVYVGDLQRSVEAYHGYSMTDEGDMKRILGRIPVDPAASAFLDVGCGKGMCMKCAVDMGFKKVAGLDIDRHLLDIAENNMRILKMDVKLFLTGADRFTGYGDYDVFYFYNPFEREIFDRVARLIANSRAQRDRDVWVAYYYPVFGDIFEEKGFALIDTLKDRTRDTVTNFYRLPSLAESGEQMGR